MRTKHEYIPYHSSVRVSSVWRSALSGSYSNETAAHGDHLACSLPKPLRARAVSLISCLWRSFASRMPRFSPLSRAEPAHKRTYSYVHMLLTKLLLQQH